jgi:hypothetical protein
VISGWRIIWIDLVITMSLRDNVRLWHRPASGWHFYNTNMPIAAANIPIVVTATTMWHTIDWAGFSSACDRTRQKDSDQ